LGQQILRAHDKRKGKIMKTKVVVGVIFLGFLVLFFPAYAQSSLAGMWTGKQGEGKNALPWSMDLKVKGNVLTGTRTITLPNGAQRCDIEEGKADGRLFAFKCDIVGPDGGNPFTATYEGFINSAGDQITVSPQKDTSGGPVTLVRK
jgi:hypothetical protein